MLVFNSSVKRTMVPYKHVSRVTLYAKLRRSYSKFIYFDLETTFLLFNIIKIRHSLVKAF